MRSACFVFLVLFSPAALAQDGGSRFHSVPVQIWNDVKGPAAASIFAYATRKMLDCFDSSWQGTCALANVTNGVDIYPEQGRHTPRFALVDISYNASDANFLSRELVIFERVSELDYRHKVDISGDRIQQH